jgi:hypothetical protein
MPSNAELKASIAELDPEVVTDGLTNAQLADKLSELREEKTKRAEAEAPLAVIESGYVVAPGKAITTKAGIKSGDEDDNEVKAEYFEGGDEALQALVESGYVLRA